MALTNEQYAAKEARMEAGIVAGNALNAAAQVVSGHAGSFASDPAEATLNLAELFRAWLNDARDEAGASPFAPPPAAVATPVGDTTQSAPSAPAPVTHEEAVANVQAAMPGTTVEVPDCPDCGGPMWDNREKKQSGQWKDSSPDFSCKDKDGCGGKVWPEKKKAPRRKGPASDRAQLVAASLA